MLNLYVFIPCATKVLGTSYIGLVLDRVVTLSFFSSAFVSKAIFFFFISKTFASSIRRLNAIAKRKQISRRIKMRLCSLYFDRNIKCLIIKKFSRCIECERFNQKCNLISSNKKMNKAINVVKKLNDKILES